VLSTKNEQAQARRNLETEFLWEQKQANKKSTKNHNTKKPQHQKTLNTHFGIGLQMLH